MLRDSPRYLGDRAASGVWLSHRPLDVGDGADAREYSGVWLSADAEVCRGCFVPAEVLNRYPVRVPTDEERWVRAHGGMDPAAMKDAHERLK